MMFTTGPCVSFKVLLLGANDNIGRLRAPMVFVDQTTENSVHNVCIRSTGFLLAHLELQPCFHHHK